jgi:hypothetical protein
MLRGDVPRFPMPPAPPVLAPDYEPNRKIKALIYGASSAVDPWASLFEDEIPWGQRLLGFQRDRWLLARDFWNAKQRAENEDDQPRLFDPETLERR